MFDTVRNAPWEHDVVAAQERIKELEGAIVGLCQEVEAFVRSLPIEFVADSFELGVVVNTTRALAKEEQAISADSGQWGSNRGE
jgi:hypothetical protein